eukprot:6466966-Amphidinium_carterae.1
MKGMQRNFELRPSLSVVKIHSRMVLSSQAATKYIHKQAFLVWQYSKHKTVLQTSVTKCEQKVAYKSYDTPAKNAHDFFDNDWPSSQSWGQRYTQ